MTSAVEPVSTPYVNDDGVSAGKLNATHVAGFMSADSLLESCLQMKPSDAIQGKTGIPCLHQTSSTSFHLESSEQLGHL
jgi:hypothetical protein